MSRTSLRFALVSSLLAGCGGGSAAVPDAALDAAPDAAVPAGDFSCVGKPRTMTAPDPITVLGKLVGFATAAGIDGASVEIHAVTGDALLGQTTTTTFGGNAGEYSLQIATGGVAPSDYRKLTASGFLDTYFVDPIPLFELVNGPDLTAFTATDIASMYQQVGIAQDSAKATVVITVLDCPTTDPSPVAGAVVTVAGAERIVYGLPYNSSATTTVSDGVATVFNAPIGPLDITVTAGPYSYRLPPIVGRANAFTGAFAMP